MRLWILNGQMVGVLTFRTDANFFGYSFQFFHVGNFKISNFAFCGVEQGMGDVPSVVGVGGCTAGHHAGNITGHNGIGTGPADPFASRAHFRFNPAGSLETNTAADSFITECTLRLLSNKPVKRRNQITILGFFQH
jgi:hypothetical protein